MRPSAKHLLLVVISLFSISALAQDNRDLPVAPEPRPGILHAAERPFVFAASTTKDAVTFKDKQASTLAAIEAGFLVSDGITTRQFVKNGYQEGDPVDRFFIGKEPTWGRMAPWGAVQDFGTYWLSARMHRSRTWVRHVWWLPEAVGTASNAGGTFWNIATDKLRPIAEPLLVPGSSFKNR